jgi:hypothetical protein
MRPMMSADEPGAEDCIQRTGFVGHASDRDVRLDERTYRQDGIQDSDNKNH